ncbi:MAG: class I SAM-dependent methyltransferase [Anaerolineales bacterium]|jgi:23S rRNA (cytosine1962-C5)-methyltransferase|nr:class I SAM-dependent methyltransferase [Anaerolineales bacterium]
MVTLRLKPGREKSLLRRHPWVFAGAIDNLDGSPTPGETVRLVSAAGDFLAWGAFSPASQIRVRIWSWDPGDLVDEAFVLRKLSQAVQFRQSLALAMPGQAQRLVHAESDGLPGLIVDQYQEWLVVQYLSCGVEYWRAPLLAGLAELTGTRNIYERSDADVRQLEGLPVRNGLLQGANPPDRIWVNEHGLEFAVDICRGHKTGFYLDQRQNRLLLRDFAAGKEVMDCFSYTGGFLLNAVKAGAKSALAIDASSEALELSKENAFHNGLANHPLEWAQADVFQALRSFRDQGRSFDLIILDPPKFAPTAAQAERAARGYKDINLLALKLLRPGGVLFTFSCSGGVSPDLFQKIIASAALDAGVEAQIIQHMHQAPDHPIALNFPEGEYLKGLVVHRV